MAERCDKGTRTSVLARCDNAPIRWIDAAVGERGSVSLAYEVCRWRGPMGSLIKKRRKRMRKKKHKKMLRRTRHQRRK